MHAGGSIEFVSLQPHSSSVSASSGSVTSVPNVVRFNHSIVQPLPAAAAALSMNRAAFTTAAVAGASADAMLGSRNRFSMRSLLQLDETALASSSTGANLVVGAFDVAAAPSANVTQLQTDANATTTADPTATSATGSAAPDTTATAAAESTSNSSSTAAPSPPSPVVTPPTSSSPPSSSSSSPRVFSPHPTSILVSYSGGVLFSHGRFAFLAPFQSSLYAAGSSSVNTQQGGARSNALNRMLVGKAASVSFEEVPATMPSAILPLATVDASANSSSSSNSSQPLGHLLSFTHFLNRGLVFTGSNCLLNLTGGLYFQSQGLLHFGAGSRTILELSDDASRNWCDGVDARRGRSLDDDPENRARIEEVVAMIARANTDPLPDLAPAPSSNSSNSSDSAAAVQDSTPDPASSPLTTGGGSGAGASISSSLASLQSSLSTPGSGGLVSRASGGGVGLLLDSAFLLVRGGRLHFRGGVIARGDSHLFLKKGSTWVVDVEPTVGAQWGTSGEDPGASMLWPTAAAAGSSPLAVPSDSGSVSFLHISGIEFSCDGLLQVLSGHLRLETPLLLIEGHGQIVCDSRRASLEMDNSRVNRAIALAQILAQSPSADNSPSNSEPEPVLVENPLAAEDPDADLYSFQPANITASNEPENLSASASAPAIVPSFRENLIAPCVTTLSCRSLLLTNGARLGVGPLTFLHLLPRARALVSITSLRGGSLYLDSGAEYAGRAFVANVSSGGGGDDAAATAGAGAGSSVMQGIYVGNSSRLLMHDAVEPLLPPSSPWTPSSSADASSPSASSATATDEVTQQSPPFCSFLSGNLSGNGVVDCGASPITLDAVVLYPSFRSPSPFSPVVYAPPPSTASTTRPARLPTINSSSNVNSSSAPNDMLMVAPRLQFDSALSMTTRTQTVLDIFGSAHRRNTARQGEGRRALRSLLTLFCAFVFRCLPSLLLSYHSIASVRLSDTATLGGSLVLNASLHVWPFDTTLGSSNSNSNNARPRGKTAAGLALPIKQQMVRALGSSGVRSGGIGGGGGGGGISLDGGSGDDVSTPAAAAAADNSTTPSSSNSSATPAPPPPPPPPPPGMDYSPLLSSGLGFLPLDSPASFDSISLASLYAVLPLGYTLEIEMVHSAASASPRVVGTGDGNVSLELPDTVRNELWLSARGPDYIQPKKNETIRRSAARKRIAEPTGSATLLVLLASLAAASVLFAS